MPTVRRNTAECPFPARPKPAEDCRARIPPGTVAALLWAPVVEAKEKLVNDRHPSGTPTTPAPASDAASRALRVVRHARGPVRRLSPRTAAMPPPVFTHQPSGYGTGTHDHRQASRPTRSSATCRARTPARTTPATWSTGAATRRCDYDTVRGPAPRRARLRHRRLRHHAVGRPSTSSSPRHPLPGPGPDATRSVGRARLAPARPAASQADQTQHGNGARRPSTPGRTTRRSGTPTARPSADRARARQPSTRRGHDAVRPARDPDVVQPSTNPTATAYADTPRARRVGPTPDRHRRTARRPDADARSLDDQEDVTPAPPAHGRPRAPRARSRRRTPAKRSALLTVAVPSACVMGVAGIAAASVGSVQRRRQQDDVDDRGRTRPPVEAGRRQQQAGHASCQSLSADADDFADRASRTQERIDLKAQQAAEKKKAAEEAARKERLRPKFALPVKQQGLSAYLRPGGHQLDVRAHRHRLPRLVRHDGDGRDRRHRPHAVEQRLRQHGDRDREGRHGDVVLPPLHAQDLLRRR